MASCFDIPTLIRFVLCAVAQPNKKTTIIPSEKEAITFAVKNAIKGSLIILCSDVIPDALALVEKFKEQETKGELVFND